MYRLNLTNCWSALCSDFFQINIKYSWGTLIKQMPFLYIKMDNFQGEVTDISAITKSLVLSTCSLFSASRHLSACSNSLPFSFMIAIALSSRMRNIFATVGLSQTLGLSWFSLYIKHLALSESNAFRSTRQSLHEWHCLQLPNKINRLFLYQWFCFQKIY